MFYFIIELLVLSSIFSLSAGETLTEFHINESRLEQSNTTLCPNAADIAPCVCIYDSDISKLTLDCTDISSDEELANVFTKEFPENDFYRFRMNSSNALTALNFTCGGVKFLRFDLFPGPFPLVEVSDLFYESCSNTELESVRFRRTQLSSLVFPPPPLSDKLIYFIMQDSNLTSVPPIRSSSLLYLHIGGSQISQIIPGTFDEIPKLRYFYFNENNVKILSNGSIPIMQDGFWYSLNSNGLETIQPGAFTLKGQPTLNSLNIYIHDNLLKTIDALVFEFLMPYISEISIYDNPLDCGCDLAWIILNSEYLAKVTRSGTPPTCTDGTLLTDLDPSTYEQLC